MVNKNMASLRKIAPQLFPWCGTVLCTGLSALIWQSELLKQWDTQLLVRYQLLQAPVKELPLKLVTIQKTGDQTWPWSSLDYAILLNTLGPFSPSVVALDLPLEDGDPLYPIYDIQLANQMARFPSIIISKTGTLPPPVPLQAAALIANSRWLQSPTDTLQKVPLAFLDQKTWLPSFVLQVAASHLGADWSKSSILPGAFILLRDNQQKLLLKIPVDHECRILIDQKVFRSKVTATDFYSAIISAEDLRNGGTGTENFHNIRRHIILVGTEAQGTYHAVNSPSGAIPPVYLNYHVINQLLSGSFSSEMNDIFYLLFLSSACLATGTLALIPSRLSSLSLLTLYFTACCIASYLSYEVGKIWWPLLPLLLGGLLSWLSARGLSHLNRHEENRQRELFSEF
jgi:CHASE2 domain-containing sensor protein